MLTLNLDDKKSAYGYIEFSSLIKMITEKKEKRQQFHPCPVAVWDLMQSTELWLCRDNDRYANNDAINSCRTR
jgi:hypothetical protein